MNSTTVKNFPDYTVPGLNDADFSPYESNGGSIVGIGGDGYAIVVADTRFSSNYNIFTRKLSKLFVLSPLSVLASTGCWADSLALVNLVKLRMQIYEQTNSKIMKTEAIAQMISVLMYSRRFFPYYVSNILAGLDEDGQGAIYSYDPIGHTERATYKAGGTAGTLLQPVLDNQIGMKNMKLENEADAKKVPLERAVSVAIDTFISAAERDIYTGDTVMVNIITKDGIEDQKVELRKD